MKGYKDSNTGISNPELTTLSQTYIHIYGLPGDASGKEPAYQCRKHKRDKGWIPGSGRSPGEGHRNPLQHSCLENPMDRGAWRSTVPGMELRSPVLQAD